MSPCAMLSKPVLRLCCWWSQINNCPVPILLDEEQDTQIFRIRDDSSPRYFSSHIKSHVLVGQKAYQLSLYTLYLHNTCEQQLILILKFTWGLTHMWENFIGQQNCHAMSGHPQECVKPLDPVMHSCITHCWYYGPGTPTQFYIYHSIFTHPGNLSN